MRKPIFFAILAAALYALNSPFSKLLLQNVPPTMMAGFLYLGAGIGMAAMGLIRQHTQKKNKGNAASTARSSIYRCHDRAGHRCADLPDDRADPDDSGKRIAAEQF